MKIEKTLFDKMPDGREVDAYKFTNSSGAFVRILSMGGIVNQIYMPDRDGNLKDVICGFDTVEGYLTGGGYQGALIGRYGNRIAKGRFTLDGVEYVLNTNNGANHLHGGNEGYNRKIWDCTPFDEGDKGGLILKYTSVDGEENYPGTLDITVTYTFDDDNRFSIHYEATTDKATPVNLTNHTYFNLNGYDGGSVMTQRMFMDCDTYTEVDDELIPVPENHTPVDGTIYDFRIEREITNPFDHNFNFADFNGMLKRRVEYFDPESGRSLTVYTDLPAVQLYTACGMNGPVNFKNGVPQRELHALCLETQYAPDSVNRPDFIPCILRPGEKYDTTTIYHFGIRK